MHKHLKIIIFVIALSLSLSGCDKPPVIREYTETFIESDQIRTKPMGHDAISQMIPQDDIHANLDLGAFQNQMPQDDIHAGLVSSADQPQMPDDEIHKNLSSGNMGMGTMTDPKLKASLEASVDKTPIIWETPQGWIEARGGGMRIVTFTNSDAGFPFEVTIIALGGNAGGVEANVIRWMRQVNIPVPSDSAIMEFINQQHRVTTQDGNKTPIIDLTTLQQNASVDTASMIASIIDRGQSQIFVKMTGTISSLTNNRDKFISLVESIETR